MRDEEYYKELYNERLTIYKQEMAIGILSEPVYTSLITLGFLEYAKNSINYLGLAVYNTVLLGLMIASIFMIKDGFKGYKETKKELESII